MNLYPTECNLCDGKVIYTSNSIIYGKEYGSGKMYYCTECGAFVGTHIPRPKEAFGILANAEMRALKQKCHKLFDEKWIYEVTKPQRQKARRKAYRELARMMEIPVTECHFGYFDTVMLNKAYKILESEVRKNE